MARIRREALDDAEQARYDAGRRKSGPAPRRPIALSPAPVESFRAPVALALLVAGICAIVAALDPGPTVGFVVGFGIGAVAMGAYLVGRAVGPGRGSLDAERGLLFAERQELTRAALAITALRRGDDRAARPDEAPGGATPPQPGISGASYLAARRSALRAVAGPGTDAGESLDPGADAGALG